MNNDSEAQDDELLALQSIYEECFHSFKEYEKDDDKDTEDNLSVKRGELKIVTELQDPFYLSFINNITGEKEKHFIRHLPPIYLHFNFPLNYPSSSPPIYTLSCKWLDRIQLSFICAHLDSLWEENLGNVIMFTWAQSLKEETLSLLNITNYLHISNTSFNKRPSSDKLVLDKATNCDTEEIVKENNGGACGGSILEYTSKIDSRAVQDISPNSNLLRVLREYDEEMKKKVFNSKLFECKVCFLEKTGSHCIEFWPCHHVYCRECMKAYFEVQIKEGNIKFLKCPEDKCDAEANPKQVESLVSLELYHKWDLMLLNSTLSSLGDIQPCPRQHCQYPVTIEDSQGQCPSCAFVFCGLCRFGWHGLEKCKFKSGEAKKILEKYMNGSDLERQELEDRYGKKYLTIMVEEFLSTNYMKENAKECPRCRSQIEKIDGCNKMTCQRCGINFCWLCEKLLDRVNPYSHFNSPNSGCFNMLFHGIEHREFHDFDDDEDDDDENHEDDEFPFFE